MTSLSEAIGNENIQALPDDQITAYLEQRLQAVRVTLLEATVNRTLTLVSVDTPESARNTQVEQFSKQIESLNNCISELESAISGTSKTPAK